MWKPWQIAAAGVAAGLGTVGMAIFWPRRADAMAAPQFRGHGIAPSMQALPILSPPTIAQAQLFQAQLFYLGYYSPSVSIADLPADIESRHDRVTGIGAATRRAYGQMVGEYPALWTQYNATFASPQPYSPMIAPGREALAMDFANYVYGHLLRT